MSTIAPSFEKAALVIVDQARQAPDKTVSFFYNPETLKRTLKPRLPNIEKGMPAESLRFTGAPEESLSLDVILDASDDLAKGDSTAEENGIHPQLAVLELLIYPRSKDVAESDKLLGNGEIEIGGGGIHRAARPLCVGQKSRPSRTHLQHQHHRNDF